LSDTVDGSPMGRPGIDWSGSDGPARLGWIGRRIGQTAWNPAIQRNGDVAPARDHSVGRAPPTGWPVASRTGSGDPVRRRV